MDATAEVLLQFDDGIELTKEVNDLTIVFSLGNDSIILCLSIFFSRSTVWYRTPPTTHAEYCLTLRSGWHAKAKRSALISRIFPICKKQTRVSNTHRIYHAFFSTCKNKLAKDVT
jgi:hypothetical protein